MRLCCPCGVWGSGGVVFAAVESVPSCPLLPHPSHPVASGAVASVYGAMATVDNFYGLKASTRGASQLSDSMTGPGAFVGGAPGVLGSFACCLVHPAGSHTWSCLGLGLGLSSPLARWSSTW